MKNNLKKIKPKHTIPAFLLRDCTPLNLFNLYLANNYFPDGLFWGFQVTRLASKANFTFIYPHHVQINTIVRLCPEYALVAYKKVVFNIVLTLYYLIFCNWCILLGSAIIVFLLKKIIRCYWRVLKMHCCYFRERCILSIWNKTSLLCIIEYSSWKVYFKMYIYCM